MTHHVLREKIEENRENVFFYKERRVGFYQFTNIKSETIVNAIKDALLRFNLQPENCKGQTYHGASNMLSKNIATATRITAENNYCSLLGSFFKFGSKNLTSLCDVLGDTMNKIGEIRVLVMFSLKRENLLINK